jgi:hypothetical protein
MRTILIAAVLASLPAAAMAKSPATGWGMEGKKGEEARVHAPTGLTCPLEHLPMMDLIAFGTATKVEPGAPFCTYKRTDDIIRVYVLGRSEKADLTGRVNAIKTAEKAALGLDPWGEIAVESGERKIFWLGAAFDPSKGKSKEPPIRSVSFAEINGWLVRLDIDYKMRVLKETGAFESGAIELRDAMTYLLGETLKKTK